MRALYATSNPVKVKHVSAQSSLLRILAILTILLSACSSDERSSTGVVREISQNRIELDVSNEMISTIGFTCEPSVCKTISRISKGDSVYIRLGSENNINKLLSIRKCAENGSECKQARDDEKKWMVQMQEASEKSATEMLQCRNKMENDLKNDNRYKSNSIRSISKQESEAISSNYKTLNQDPSKKVCTGQVLNDHHQAFLESCQKFECGKDIGGGCYHISGNIFNDAVFQHAIDKCGI